jgi:predicted ATPase
MPDTAKIQDAVSIERSRKAQLSMLPKLPEIPGLEIAAVYKPCEHVGGDFYDLFIVGRYRLGIVIGDVSGHGVEAALIMAAAKKALQIHGQGAMSPKETLLAVNNSIKPEMPQGTFVSLYFAIFDLKEQTLTSARAGHCPMLVANNGNLRQIAPNGMVLGMASNEMFAKSLSEETITVAPGDTLLLYTDGVSETANAAKDEFGEERIGEALKRLSNVGAKEAAEKIEAEIAAFRGEAPPDDDVTLLALRYVQKADDSVLIRLVKQSAAQTNLSAPTTSFVGREKELKDLAAHLRDEKLRLVTITGPGGTGKTRISQQLGYDFVDRFPGGAWFADLSEATSAESIGHTVLQAFGVPVAGQEAPEQVVASVLEQRKPLLLVLDNFEQVVKYAKKTIGLWRQRAPNVRFVVTSRALLGLEGEREYVLGPLPAPVSGGTPEALMRFDSVKLFVERARQANAKFELSTANSDAVARICAELDGMPLAIELAAARCAIMTPEQMLPKLKQRFSLLRSTRSDLPARQQTLEGAIDWSYELLSDWEKAAFQQAWIFHEGFFLDAAEAVIDLSDYPDAPMVMDAIQSLREKSFCRVRQTDFGPRFSLYVALRDFASQQWAKHAPAEKRRALTRRFAEYFVKYADEWNSRIDTRDAAEALHRLELERENQFAIQDWALRDEKPKAGAPTSPPEAADPERVELGVRSMVAIADLLRMRGPNAQRLPRLQKALAAMGDAVKDAPAQSELRLRITWALSRACSDVGLYDLALKFDGEAMALAQKIGTPRLLFDAHMAQGGLRVMRGQNKEALQSYEAAEPFAKQLGDKRSLGLLANSRANAQVELGDFNHAIENYSAAEVLMREAGCRHSLAGVVGSKASLHYYRNEPEEALRGFNEAIDLAQELGDRASVARNVGNRGNVLVQRGQYPEALKSFNEAEAVSAELGKKAWRATFLGNRSSCLLNLGDFEGALECAAQAEAVSRELKDNAMLARTLSNKGNAIAAQGKFKDALACFDEAEKLTRPTGSKRTLLNVLSNYGLALAKALDFARAVQVLNEAVDLLEGLNQGRTPLHFSLLGALAASQASVGQNIESERNAALAMSILDGLKKQNAQMSERDLEWLPFVQRGGNQQYMAQTMNFTPR